jgi:hypothetical protein
VRTFQGLSAPVWNLAVANKKLYAKCADRTVKEWSLATGLVSALAATLR